MKCKRISPTFNTTVIHHNKLSRNYCNLHFGSTA